MHAIEKIICKNAKRKSIEPHSFADVEVDFTILNDMYSMTFDAFCRLRPGMKLFNPDKFALCFNYFSAPATASAIAKKKKVDALLKENKGCHIFDIYRGTWQEEFINSRFAKCSDIVLSADLHTSALGGLGILAFCGGESDLAAAMATGKMWVKSPEIVNIVLDGKTQPGISPVDVALHTLKEIDRDFLTGKAVEFTGQYIEEMDAPSRMTFCDIFSELDMMTCYIKPSKDVISFLERKSGKECRPMENDEGFKFAKSFSFDVTKVQPMVSLSPDFSKIHKVSDLEDQAIKVTEGFIGGCQSGQTKDIAPVYEVLKGKRLPDKSTLTISPASYTVLRDCMNLGYMKEFERAGAKCVSTGCSSCIGMREDAMSFGNPILTDTCRTFCGRMKVKKVKLYMASALTVTQSVMKGCISNPIGEENKKDG